MFAYSSSRGSSSLSVTFVEKSDRKLCEILFIQYLLVLLVITYVIYIYIYIYEEYYGTKLLSKCIKLTNIENFKYIQEFDPVSWHSFEFLPSFSVQWHIIRWDPSFQCFAFGIIVPCSALVIWGEACYPILNCIISTKAKNIVSVMIFWHSELTVDTSEIIILMDTILNSYRICAISKYIYELFYYDGWIWLTDTQKHVREFSVIVIQQLYYLYIDLRQNNLSVIYLKYYFLLHFICQVS